MYIDINNTRKRKNPPDQDNEYNKCIDNMIKLIKKYKSIDFDKLLVDLNTNFSDTDEMILLDIMNEIHKMKLNNNNKINLLEFLNKLKNNTKKFKMNTASNNKHVFIIDNFNSEDEDEEDDDDFDPLDFIKSTTSKAKGKAKEFMDKLSKVSDGVNGSKNKIIDHFNSLNPKCQTHNLELISNLENTVVTTPYIFKILNAPINDNTKKNIIVKLTQCGNFGSGKIKKWVDDVMKLPFGIYKGIELNKLNKPHKIKAFLDNLENLMNKSVYGHDNAKKQIIQIMAQQIRNPQSQGTVIGIYGPPGNGKTSLVKEGIAKAMDKPFIFISLGGAQDSSFLDGHSFTYEGSIYGRIAQALIDAKCSNPIIYFDELDKVSETHKGEEIINLLIHLIDPSQNKLFRDKYFYDIDIDLSKVTFIFSFNDCSKINYILRDRITLIETKYLTNEMKLHIASNYLIPSICEDIGIPVNSIEISKDIMENIINNYTNEGGVRKLKEKLYKIYRELNHTNLTKNKILNYNINFPLTLTDELYEHLFKNIPKYIHLTVHKENGVGMVNGLWANSLGQGGVLPIESVLIPSKHIMSVKATGSLGEVIKESIEVALSVAWNKLDNDIKLEWMNKWKSTPECFHIHCPDGSTGKEGPSAGAAMTLTFYSRLTNRKIKHTVAMTGEINLRGEVTEIGGLDEKLNAAKRAGAKLALVPFNNKIDLENVIKNNTSLIDDNFKVLLVENIDQVIEHALL